MPQEYKITEITYKCPKCGKEYSEDGHMAEIIIGCQTTCGRCGFVGDFGY
jgi:hypothetical protein